MQNGCPLPFNEDYRLAVLRSYRILDSEAEPAFDRLVRLAAELAEVPVALISLIDQERQWFKAKVGLDVAETPRDISFCQHAIMRSDPLIVPDASQDPRFADNPLVTGEMHLRFYAGFPLTVPEGVRLGTLCMVDFAPRPAGLSPALIGRLKDVAASITSEMALRRSLLEARADTSARVQRAERLAADAEAAKHRFLSMAGHELRTPLTGILGLCELMEAEIHGPIGNPRYREFVESIHSCGTRLHQTVERILTYARAAADEFELNESAFDPLDIVRAVAATVLPVTGRGDVTVQFEECGPAAWLYADRGQFEHMVAQLLDNAIKFSHCNATVRIAIERDVERGLTVAVHDQGRGVDTRRIEELKRAFVQADEGDARSHEGMGLGLPIVDRLARMHGADLLLDRRNGDGTTARLVFPAYRLRAPAPAAAGSRLSLAS
ncbi:MAG: GAF domain-containing sensor histidine kinase [Alphaproteobacteria bacterium]